MLTFDFRVTDHLDPLEARDFVVLLFLTEGFFFLCLKSKASGWYNDRTLSYVSSSTSGTAL